MTHFIRNIILLSRTINSCWGPLPTIYTTLCYYQEQSTNAEVQYQLYTQHYFIIKNNQLMLRSMTHYIRNIILLSRTINSCWGPLPTIYTTLCYYQEQSTHAEVQYQLYTQYYFIIKNNQLMLRSNTNYIHNIILLSRTINSCWGPWPTIYVTLFYSQEQSTHAEVQYQLYTQHYFIIKNNQLMLRSMTHYIRNIILLSRTINSCWGPWPTIYTTIFYYQESTNTEVHDPLYTQHYFIKNSQLMLRSITHYIHNIILLSRIN